MTSNSDKVVRLDDRRNQARNLIRKLFAERADMLVLFCRVAGLEPYAGNKAENHPAKMLEEFCQLLVDYIAAGHFSLYDRIVNGQERRREIITLAEKVYPRIAATTDAALDFNDKYNCGDQCNITNELHDDLSRLGEELAIRIELEDQLAQALCGSYDDQLRQA